MSKRQRKSRKGTPAPAPEPAVRPANPPALAANAILLSKEAVDMTAAVFLQRISREFGQVNIVNGQPKTLILKCPLDMMMPVMNQIYGMARCVQCERFAYTYQFGDCATADCNDGAGCMSGFCSQECAQQGLDAHAAAGHPQYVTVQMNNLNAPPAPPHNP